MMPVVVWLCVVVAAALLEMATTQLVSIWFAVGGVGAIIACELNAPVPVQIMVFVVVTALTLVFTRPVAHRALAVKKTSTNADRYIGRIAVVTLAIDNMRGEGQVNVLGSIWTARSADGSPIPAGRDVIVVAIDGVKLIVRPKPND